MQFLAETSGLGGATLASNYLVELLQQIQRAERRQLQQKFAKTSKHCQASKETVRNLINGSYSVAGDNHGKPMWKKEQRPRNSASCFACPERRRAWHQEEAC